MKVKIVALCIGLLVSLQAPALSLPPGLITIDTFNPYSIKARIELKCDYNYKTKTYQVHQWIYVQGKSNTRVNVSNTVRYCELWPKIML